MNKNKKMQAHPVASWAIAYESIYRKSTKVEDEENYLFDGAFFLGTVFGFAITYLAVIVGVIR